MLVRVRNEFHGACNKRGLRLSMKKLHIVTQLEATLIGGGTGHCSLTDVTNATVDEKVTLCRSRTSSQAGDANNLREEQQRIVNVQIRVSCRNSTLK
ncbi:hypothetical protein J6590_038176 [Homalodisca vitripennis]|nr:hypothetical protein J6590_038176 [Homalodisca vitripennis]